MLLIPSKGTFVSPKARGTLDVKSLPFFAQATGIEKAVTPTTSVTATTTHNIARSSVLLPYSNRENLPSTARCRVVPLRAVPVFTCETPRPAHDQRRISDPGCHRHSFLKSKVR